METVTIMMIPHGFKIRKKSDVEVFIKQCLCNGDYYIITDTGEQYIFSKSADEISVCVRTGDLHDIFNPSLEVATTRHNGYEKTVEDYVWQNRKYINAKWFSEDK